MIVGLTAPEMCAGDHSAHRRGDARARRSALGNVIGSRVANIGLTVVAIGTSLPELATSVIASRCGHFDLAVGNVAGSNLYNVLLVLEPV